MVPQSFESKDVPLASVRAQVMSPVPFTDRTLASVGALYVDSFGSFDIVQNGFRLGERGGDGEDLSAVHERRSSGGQQSHRSEEGAEEEEGGETGGKQEGGHTRSSATF